MKLDTEAPAKVALWASHTINNIQNDQKKKSILTIPVQLFPHCSSSIGEHVLWHGWQKGVL